MKTFRFIGMAITAILISVNFTACSSDDDENSDTPIKNEDGIITNQKKLIVLKEVYDESEERDDFVATFSYDSKGKLITVVQIDDYDNNGEFTNITWDENTIKESSDCEYFTYYINDGLVRTGLESDGRYYSFVYNSSKQLTTYQYGKGYHATTRTLTWENGKIGKIVVKSTSTRNDNEDEYTCTYSGKTCKGYNPLMAFDMVRDDFKVMLAHPELVGMCTTQLPDQIYSKKDFNKYEYYIGSIKETYKYESITEGVTKYTYKLNSDGYVESVTAEETDIQTDKHSFQDKNGDGKISDDERNIIETHTDTSTDIYTFKWE